MYKQNISLLLYWTNLLANLKIQTVAKKEIGAINGILQPLNNYTKFWKLEISKNKNSCSHVVYGRLDTYPCKTSGHCSTSTCPRNCNWLLFPASSKRPVAIWTWTLRSQAARSGLPNLFQQFIEAVCVITGKLVHVFISAIFKAEDFTHVEHEITAQPYF